MTIWLLAPAANAAEPDFAALATEYTQWPPAVEAVAPPKILERCRMLTRGADTPHHGDRIVVHVNEVGRPAFAQTTGERTFPEGSIIVKVKRDLDPTAKPLGLGIMVKREAGFAPERQDWQYAMVEQGEVHADPKTLEHCASCHTGGKLPDQDLEGARIGDPRDAVFLSGPVDSKEE